MEKVEVQIRRKVEKTHLPTKVMNNSKKAIASVYSGRNPLGIPDKDLEKDLLTRHLNIDENDRNYGDKRDNFWINFRVVVPVEGKILNISTDQDGNPNNVEEYLTYKWIENHPLVADSKQDMIQSPKKEFYIHDPVRETQKDNIKVQSKKKAYIELSKIAENNKKLDMLVRLLVGLDPSSMSKEQKENHLDSYIDENPSKFVKMSTDKDLEIRSQIEQMVDKGILRKQGASYLYMDTTIGDSIGEAISFFKNERNSELVLDLKSKLKDIV